MKYPLIIIAFIIVTLCLLIAFNKNNNDLGRGFYLEHSDRGELDFYYPDSIKLMISNLDTFRFDNNYIVIKYEGTKYEIDTIISNSIDTSDLWSENVSSIKIKYNKLLPIKTDTILDKTYLYKIIHKYPFYYYGPYYKEEYIEAMKILNLPNELMIDD